MNEASTARMQRYVENLGRGMTSFPAAKAAGYSDSYARVIATRTKNNPMVAQAIESIRAEGRKLACYDVTVAMQEALDDHAFAIQKGNAMAAVKATELRAKLSGLLIDRVEVVEVDLTGALARAEMRVINASAPLPNGALGPVTPLSLAAKGPIDWRPRIAGSQVAENPDTGPADGQARS